jgi:hypothetical protein
MFFGIIIYLRHSLDGTPPGLSFRGAELCKILQNRFDEIGESLVSNVNGWIWRLWPCAFKNPSGCDVAILHQFPEARKLQQTQTADIQNWWSVASFLIHML